MYIGGGPDCDIRAVIGIDTSYREGSATRSRILFATGYTIGDTAPAPMNSTNFGEKKRPNGSRSYRIADGTFVDLRMDGPQVRIGPRSEYFSREILGFEMSDRLRHSGTCQLICVVSTACYLRLGIAHMKASGVSTQRLQLQTSSSCRYCTENHSPRVSLAPFTY